MKAERRAIQLSTREPDLGNASGGRQKWEPPPEALLVYRQGEQFVDSMKRAVVFANGDLPDPAAVRALLRPDDWIVAADGGTTHALACGVRPQLVIGDLDSLPAGLKTELAAEGAAFITHPADKDWTDLELALLYVAANGAVEVLVVAALGGRLDQTLANVLLLARPELARLQVRITDGRETAWLVRDETTVHGTAGERVSLIPLGGDAVDVHTAGLAWPLRGETLRLGEARGVSNEMTGSLARVQIGEGLLLCVHARSDEGPTTADG